jgi:TRAP-type C4-dicarboxylate transport system permease small subunit
LTLCTFTVSIEEKYFTPGREATIFGANQQGGEMKSPSIQGLFYFIQRVEAWLLSSSIILIATLIILNVFSRSLFNRSLAFTEELSQFLIILVTFVGLSYAASQGRHIRMTAIYDQLSRRARKVLMLCISGSTSLLLFFLTFHAIHYVSVVYSLGSVSPVLQVPLFLVYCAAPLGLMLAGIQYLLTFVRNLSSHDVYLSYSKKDEYETPVTGEI